MFSADIKCIFRKRKLHYINQKYVTANLGEFLCG